MMRPKTKLQNQVVALSKKLPKITKVHKDWAYAKLFKFYAMTTKHTANCFECGHQWKQESNLITTLIPFECPKCHKQLVPAKTQKWGRVDLDYFQIVTVLEGFQVIRAFQIHRDCRKGRKAKYDTFSLYEHWISPKGKLVIYSIQHGSSFYNDYWNWGTEMQVKEDLDKYYISNSAPVYPGRKILPTIRRNGFKGNNYCGLNPTSLFRLLLSQPRCETLIKAGQTKMVGGYLSYGFDDYESDYSGNAYRRILVKSKIEKYWPQIKICIRNNYKILDPSTWFDQLRLLEEFGKDIHNAKFICPLNLTKEHQKLIDKKQAIQEREELEKLNAKIEKDNRSFQKDKGQYFGLKFSNGEISIVTLDHVREFFIEGKKLHHCVFSNEYYKKKDTLILSARKENERLETIELSLKSLKVIQSRGTCNQNSPFYDEILSLVNSNMPAIRKIVKNEKETVPEESCV